MAYRVDWQPPKEETDGEGPRRCLNILIVLASVQNTAEQGCVHVRLGAWVRGAGYMCAWSGGRQLKPRAVCKIKSSSLQCLFHFFSSTLACLLVPEDQLAIKAEQQLEF